MNHYGPWSWQSTRQEKVVRTEEERAYAKRVTAKKRRASANRRRAKETQERQKIRAINNAPLDKREVFGGIKPLPLSRCVPRVERAARERRAAAVIRATPIWGDADAMLAIYDVARRLSEETGIPHHVDHIVPIQSPWVCGLHCEANLRPLPALENVKKGAKRWPGMPDRLDRRIVAQYRRLVRTGLT